MFKSFCTKTSLTCVPANVYRRWHAMSKNTLHFQTRSWHVPFLRIKLKTQRSHCMLLHSDITKTVLCLTINNFFFQETSGKHTYFAFFLTILEANPGQQWVLVKVMVKKSVHWTFKYCFCCKEKLNCFDGVKIHPKLSFLSFDWFDYSTVSESFVVLQECYGFLLQNGHQKWLVSGYKAFL